MWYFQKNSMATQDRLEILSTNLLEQYRSQATELKAVAKSVRQEFGWHYLLDLIWIINQLDLDALETVMDAGAGLGVLQWFLASKGIKIISVDRIDRSDLALHFRARFKVSGMRPEDLSSDFRAITKAIQKPVPLKKKMRRLGRDLFSLFGRKVITSTSGMVIFYNQDLKMLVDIPDDSVDAIVSVSALEHNEPEDLGLVVRELMRVLKPGGKLVATMSTSGNEDKFHQPSLGWVYSETSLRKYFDLGEDILSNYDNYPALLEEIRNSSELRDTLAKFYYKSGGGGMPWGVWDPQYVPVGICKVKPLTNTAIV